MARFRTDKDYIDAGVEPPEHIVHHGSDHIRPDVHLHKWQARGPFLHCDQGQNGHGIPYDHINKIFNGTGPNGEPLFKDVVISDKNPYTTN